MSWDMLGAAGMRWDQLGRAEEQGCAGMCLEMLGCAGISWDILAHAGMTWDVHHRAQLPDPQQTWLQRAWAQLCPSIPFFHHLFIPSHTSHRHTQTLEFDCCSQIPGKGREAGIWQSTFILGTPTSPSITAHETWEFYGNNNFGIVCKNTLEGFP